MRFSEAKGHKVVSTDSAETVGKVAGFVVDPRSASVVALSLKKTGDHGTTLPWTGITAFGPDAVTVAGTNRLITADERLLELSADHREIVKKQVLDQFGRRLGVVKDVDFDPADGKLSTLLLDTGEVAGDRLIGVGSYAVVVRG